VSNPEDGGPPNAGADDGGDGAGRAAGTGEVTGTGAAAAAGTALSGAAAAAGAAVEGNAGGMGASACQDAGLVLRKRRRKQVPVWPYFNHTDEPYKEGQESRVAYCTFCQQGGQAKHISGRGETMANHL